MILAGLVVVTGFIIWLVVQSMPSNAVREKQAAFLLGIETRSSSRVFKTIAEDYTDRWEFSREDLIETTLDAGSQFMVMVVKGEEISYERDGKTAIVKMNLKISGKPLGIFGNEITRRINSLKKPFVLTWEKQSFLPFSWRLVRMDNPALPDKLYGYTPGALRKMMNEGLDDL